MRELILLRHAHANALVAGQPDADRALSSEGRREARSAAVWLRERGLAPDRILVSPARRTQQTVAAVVAELGAIPTHEESGIYEASPGDLVELLDHHRDATRLLLIGHNPGLEQLVALLHSGQSSDYRGIPPAGIVVLRLPAETAIEPGTASLAAFWWP